MLNEIPVVSVVDNPAMDPKSDAKLSSEERKVSELGPVAELCQLNTNDVALLKTLGSVVSVPAFPKVFHASKMSAWV